MRSNEYILPGIEQPVKIRRDSHGVPLISAATWEEAFYGLGWVHGRDRGGQVYVTHIAASGRLCEIFQDDPVLLALDRHYRWLGFARHARAFIHTLDPASRTYVEAYCQGLNYAWEKRRPGILRLLRHRPEPFTAADVLAIIKLLSFAGLAEGQRLAELFIIQAVHRGVDEQRLQALLPALDSLEPALIHGLRAIPELFPAEQLFVGQPYGIGSNGWAVAGERSTSGAPILCNDPHLQADRLPAVLAEVQLQVGADWVHGGTIPGLPGVLTGRNRFLAWGLTYACVDSSDFFIERCSNGGYQREGGWVPFREYRERILRKRHPPVEFSVFENEHGILEEGNPYESGDYLCWGWSGLGASGIGAIKAFLNLIRCSSVAEGQTALRAAEIPNLNVVLADRSGTIGYQMVGRVPRRRQGWSGLAPVAGWDKANDWQGWLDPIDEIPALSNPPEGIIVTANEARQHPNGPLLATIPQPRYRQARIIELLASKQKFDSHAMQGLHYDVLSLQARRLLPLILPYVPAGAQRALLADWDLCYTPESEAATLFENIYLSILIEVFGNGGLGREWTHYLLTKTILLVVLFDFFDAVLCQEDSLWLPAGKRDAILAKAVSAGLQHPIEPWGKRNAIIFRNIFLGGRLPRILGFDPGPYPLPGSRATVHQGTRIPQLGRDLLCAPCYHFITDLSTHESWANLPGGPSESRFSRYYTNELRRWLKGDYKKL